MLLDWRVPSQYERCRRAYCPFPPVADLKRSRYQSSLTYAPIQRGMRDSWWAYCATHLEEYARYVVDGEVVFDLERKYKNQETRNAE